MDQADFERAKSALRIVPELVGQLLDEQSGFLSGSQAAEAYGVHEDAAGAAYAQMGMALASASDHLWALERALTPPILTLAPWTIARGSLETSALILWQLDPQLDAKGQLSRSLRTRLKGLRSQRALSAQVGASFPESESPREAARRLDDRINHLAQLAETLGIEVKRNKKDFLIGFSESPSTTTAMIDTVLPHGGTQYRLLSAVAHGEAWAIQQVGYRIIRDSRGVATAEQSISLMVARFLIFFPAAWYLAAAKRYFGWNGWDVDQLTDLTSAACADAGVKIIM